VNAPSYPHARVELTRKYIGAVSFDDPYDWLQRDTEEALTWQWQQDALASAYVRQWPDFERLHAAVVRAADAGGALARTPPRLLSGKWFWGAPTQRSAWRTLWVGDTPDAGRPLVETPDLADRPEDAASTNLYWFEPSPDASYVAIAVTSAGAMIGEWRVVEVATGRLLDVREPAAAYTGGLPGWLPDGGGFYLHDRAEGGRHRLRFVPVRPGTAARPSVTFEFTDIPANVSGLTPEVSPDGRWVIALAGPHERIAYMIGDTRSNAWRRFVPHGYEGECSGAWLDGNTYIARAHGGDAPRGRIVAVPAAASQDLRAWREIEPQTAAVLRAVSVMAGRIVIADLWHVSARFRTLALDGRDEVIVPLETPGSSMIAYIFRRFDRSEALTFDYMTFTRPTTLYRYDTSKQAAVPITEAPAETANIKVSQRFARSLDGTSVPYFVIHRADLDLTRPQPAILTGYGGFNAAFLPVYLGHLQPFVEAGGIILHANLRGGAEYGRHWHDAGRLASKWNVFLDLFAVAETAIRDRLTEPAKLAMTGTSNGGLLAGAAIAHRPDLFRVVVPVVPIFDQLEPVPPDPQFEPVRAIFFEDYGDPRDPVMSKVLHSYSPYHNVSPAVAYPAVFQVFGEKDLGCMPFHGRKFTARLQAATTSGHPVLLRVWKNTGHGAIGEVGQLQATEWLAFIMRELGMRLA
jgi:prolyl oligopeptidase